MIDLHTHVLYGLDDGARDSVESVAMAAAAVDAGTTVLVATPHFRDDHPGITSARIRSEVDELNRTLAGHGVGLLIEVGAEVDLRRAALTDDQELRQLTLGGNGRDLLVETPYGPLPDDYEYAVAQIRERGFRVVAAHPERNPTFQQDPTRLGKLVAGGVLVQVTAGSLTGRRRSPARKLAVEAVRNRWVHVIASDSHGVALRPPDLRPAFGVAARALKQPVERVRASYAETAERILAGADLRD